MKILKLVRECTFLALTIVFISCIGCSKSDDPVEEIKVPEMNIKVPLGGNAWVVDNPFNGGNLISEEGLTRWGSSSDKVRVYFKLPKAGNLHLGLNAKVQKDKSTIKCTFGTEEKEVVISSTNLSSTYVSTFEVTEPGYHFVELEGITKGGSFFADVNAIMLGGDACDGKMYFVNEEYYWGRRGPSVHLAYEVPSTASNVEYFYNEVTVPKGEDVIGSYYMANGFGEGYFGIQVNSESERRVLFSVWSPYHTDDPNSIPEDEKIILVKKGEGVSTGEFGNEGSGGQSFLRYNWITGNTYQFLLKGEPLTDGYTQYTAWFKGPELQDWKLIASFKRPKTQTWLTNQYSFLENFHTETGALSRMALYNNQWVRDTNGDWYEMTKAKFTADATARKESRMDYAGGVENGVFFMKNCGFFNETTTIDSYHERTPLGIAPEIDFNSLP